MPPDISFLRIVWLRSARVDEDRLQAEPGASRSSGNAALAPEPRSEGHSVPCQGGTEMADARTATCACGAVEVRIEGEPVIMAYCHCESCRRWLAAPIHAAALWPTRGVTVTRGEARLGEKQVDPEHLALALLSVKAGSCYETLKEFSIEPDYVTGLILESMGMEPDDVPEWF